MNIDDVWDVFRWLTLSLSVVAYIGLWYDWQINRHRAFCSKEKMTFLAINITTIAIGYAALESVLSAKTTGGPRTLLTFFAMVIVCIRNTMDWDEDRLPGGLVAKVAEQYGQKLKVSKGADEDEVTVETEDTVINIEAKDDGDTEVAAKPEE